MAQMNFRGVDDVRVPFNKLMSLGDEQVMSVVNAGAKVVLEAQQKYLRQHHHRTGELEASLGVKEYPKLRSANVEPTATGKGKGKRKRNKLHSRSGAAKRAGHHGATGGSTMQDVAYYLAMGTKKMRATDWDKKANEEAAEEVGKAMAAAWDSVISAAGL